ncbi:PIF1-like protein, partial [Mya arenaria]
METITMTLNDQQYKALEEHNVLIYGQAISGKPHLVNLMYEQLTECDKNVAVTATTGTACTLYKQLNAMTLECNDTAQVGGSWRRTTDFLIIDECSMLSEKLFECLFEVMKLKNGDKPFGGMQSNLFEFIPHKVALKDIFRQKDKELADVINKVSTGFVSESSMDFMKTLKRLLKCKTVDDFNRQHILENAGELFEFKSSDSGAQKQLDRLLAPKVSWIKVGVPYIVFLYSSSTFCSSHLWHNQSDPSLKLSDTLTISSKFKHLSWNHVWFNISSPVSMRADLPALLFRRFTCICGILGGTRMWPNDSGISPCATSGFTPKAPQVGHVSADVPVTP